MEYSRNFSYKSIIQMIQLGKGRCIYEESLYESQTQKKFKEMDIYFGIDSDFSYRLYSKNRYRIRIFTQIAVYPRYFCRCLFFGQEICRVCKLNINIALIKVKKQTAT